MNDGTLARHDEDLFDGLDEVLKLMQNVVNTSTAGAISIMLIFY